MEPGCDGDVDLHESWYWSVSLCANVGGSGGGGGGAVVVHVDGADGVVSDGVLVVLLAMVLVTMVGMLVGVGRVGVVLSQVVEVLW